MDKEVLIQHCEMKAEIKDIRSRKEKLEKEIGRLGIVSDTVKGTRLDGTYGSIKITGYPRPEYYRKRAAIERHKKLLEEKKRNCWSLRLRRKNTSRGYPRANCGLCFACIT